MNTLALILTVGALAASPAHAEPATATIVVQKSDYQSSQSRARLDLRIRGAIETVCGSYAAIEPYQAPELDKCWDDARHQVAAKLSNLKTDARIELVSR